MREDLERLRAAAIEALARDGSEEGIEAVRVRFLGRKGELTAVVRQMRGLSPEERPVMGALLNEVKDDLERRIVEALAAARAAAPNRRIAGERIDVTLPGRRLRLGRLHPLTQVMEELIDIFCGLGFSVAEGPEIED